MANGARRIIQLAADYRPQGDFAPETRRRVEEVRCVCFTAYGILECGHISIGQDWDETLAVGDQVRCEDCELLGRGGWA